ncbi:MAG TPA: pyrroline-5-carboxylate reductase [Chlamydiales bacterium]|jgi:pyrroline-5-carboxylate reductase|nr:pyrroline-5-carboxylate reductase [Chlamydiales bacterium]
MKMSEHHIGFMGFGHLAQVIFTALERAKIVPRSQVLFVRRDRAKMQENEKKFGITATSLSNLVAKSDLLFLCMRPQQAEKALTELKEAGSLEGKQIITLLAGKKIAFYQTHLGPGIQIVRAMPNIASSVAEGMTILSYGPKPSADFKSTVSLLFSALGSVAEMGEDLMDTATAMAGSGPGFVFRLIEAMARSGERAGMPYPEALKIAAQTFAGAARLILKGELPQDLLAKIATPNGVTQAGLDVMTHHEIDTHFQSVIEAAARRSRELS